MGCCSQMGVVKSDGGGIYFLLARFDSFDIFFVGHTERCSGLTPGFALRNHSRWGWGVPIACQGWSLPHGALAQPLHLCFWWRFTAAPDFNCAGNMCGGVRGLCAGDRAESCRYSLSSLAWCVLSSLCSSVNNKTCSFPKGTSKSI